MILLSQYYCYLDLFSLQFSSLFNSSQIYCFNKILIWAVSLVLRAYLLFVTCNWLSHVKKLSLVRKNWVWLEIMSSLWFWWDEDKKFSNQTQLSNQLKLFSNQTELKSTLTDCSESQLDLNTSNLDVIEMTQYYFLIRKLIVV